MSCWYPHLDHPEPFPASLVVPFLSSPEEFPVDLTSITRKVLQILDFDISRSHLLWGFQFALYLRQLLSLSKKGFPDNLSLCIAKVKLHLYSKAHKPCQNTYRSLLLLVLTTRSGLAHIYVNLYNEEKNHQKTHSKSKHLSKTFP